MTTVVPPEGEDLLRAAALGQLDRTAPEVAARLQADPELLRAVEELERTRHTTARVLEEGAEMTERARAEATSADRTLVHETLQNLARGGESKGAGGRRGWILLFAGLAAAAVLGFFVLRALQPPIEPAHDVPLGDAVAIGYVEAADGTFSLSWRTERAAGEKLELSFYALRNGARQEPLLPALSVGTDGWHPTPEQAQLLSTSDWVAELVRIDAGGEAQLLGHMQRSSPH